MSALKPGDIRSGDDCRDEPGREADESFAAWWLASLSMRYPGRRFRLVSRPGERLPVGLESGARQDDPVTVGSPDDLGPLADRRVGARAGAAA